MMAMNPLVRLQLWTRLPSRIWSWSSILERRLTLLPVWTSEGCVTPFGFSLSAGQTRSGTARCRPTGTLESQRRQAQGPPPGACTLVRATRLAAHKACGGAAHTFDASWSEEFNTVVGDRKFCAAQVRLRPTTVALRSLIVSGNLLLRRPQFVTALTLRSSRTAPIAPTTMGTRFAESGRVHTTSAATRARVRCRTSASAVYSPTGWRLALCSRGAKPIALQRTKAAGSDIVMAVRECHPLP